MSNGGFGGIHGRLLRALGDDAANQIAPERATT